MYKHQMRTCVSISSTSLFDSGIAQPHQHDHINTQVERARAAVVGHAETLRRLDPTLAVNYVVLDLPCTFFMLAHLGYVV